MDDKILIRFLNKKHTSEDLLLIEGWIKEDKAHADWLFEMEQIWSLKNESLFSRSTEVTEAYNRFINSRPEAKISNSKRRIKLSWIGYAAAIIIIAVMGINLLKMQKEVEIIAQSMNVIEVPKGQRTTLTLTDGTKVWLNAESRLVYPASFTAKNREVTLEGEGFFEVTRNDKSPFIVRTDLIEVAVLGTKFNVEAYPDEMVFVTLTEGKVEVASNNDNDRVTLEKNDQASYSRESGLNVKRGISADLLRSWTSGEFSYIDKTLSYIVNDLQRRFNVRITILDKELENETFSSRVYDTNDVEKVLNLLKETRRMNYRKTTNQYELFKNQK